MKGKFKLITLAMIFVIIFTNFTSAELNVVNSMDFEGDHIKLTLNEAIDIMLKDNPTIQKAELVLEEARTNHEKQRRSIKEIKKVKDALPSLAAIELPSDSDIELLEFVNKFAYEDAKRTLEAAIEAQKANIESSYFGLLQAQDLAEINKANMEIAKDLYERAKQKLELGLVARQEVLNSELNLINAENQYKQSENAVKMAKMALNTMLGLDVMANTVLEDTLEFKEYELPSIAEAVSMALNNRREIKAAEFQYEYQKRNMDIISKRYPDITYQYKEQKINVEKALKDLETARKAIEMEVRSNYLEVQQKREEILAGQKAVELAEEALRLTQLSYDVGMAVLTDVQQAQTMLQQAKLGLSKAILDYNLAVLKFEDSIRVGRASTQSPNNF